MLPKASPCDSKLTLHNLVVGTVIVTSTGRASTIAIVLLPQSRKPLLLGVGVDICANNEGNNIEEWHPSLLRQEFLGKGQRDR